MKLTIDNKTGPKLIENPNWSIIENAISQLDNLTISFCVLESDNGDYIQCAGSAERLTTEIREYIENSFKHYRLGIRKDKKIFKNVWTMIDCKVGPIRVYDYEVLDFNDAIALYLDFFKGNELMTDKYNKRNITRDFK